MNSLSAAELARMRSTQISSLMDTCVVQRYSASANSYNELIPTWTDDASSTACGLDMRSGSERYGNKQVSVVYDASLRLPITVSVDVKDRIKITRRYGEILSTPLVYDIAGPVQRGPSGIRLLLRKLVL